MIFYSQMRQGTALPQAATICAMSQRRDPLQIGEWYHCHNFGIDRRKLFIAPRDFDRFLSLLLACTRARPMHISNLRDTRLTTLLDESGRLDKLGAPIVQIGAYALTPRHVHLILKEEAPGGITAFMQRVCTGYTMYFNKKYPRSGPLFAGRFKSRHLSTARHFKQAINYVHMYPAFLYDSAWPDGLSAIGKFEDRLRSYKYSSLLDHLFIERPESKLLGAEIFQLYESPSSLSLIMFDAQAYHREAGNAQY